MVTRPNQPVAQLTQHKLSTDVAAQQQQQQQQLQQQNHDSTELSKASHKKNSSVSPQLNRVMKDVNSTNASTRQPTPGINDSNTLFESSLENFQTFSKSNLVAQAGSKLRDSEKKATPPPDENWNSKGYFGDSKPHVKTNKNNEYGHSSSKLPSLSNQPTPSWQAGANASNENKRTLYNPVSGKQRNVAAGKAGYVSGAGAGEGNPTSHHRTAAWARSKRESVEFEGLLADITFGVSGAVRNARKQPDGYVL